MFNCPSCNATLDEMDPPRIKCPDCGTILDTPPISESRQNQPPPAHQQPVEPFHQQDSGQYPSSKNYSVQQKMYPMHAGLGKRYVAFLIDSMILFIINIPVTFLIVGTLIVNPWSTDYSDYSSTSPIMAILASAVITIGYFIPMEGIKQQTLGKMIMKLIVVDTKMQPIDMHASMIRNGLRILYFIPPIGYFIYFIDASLIHRKNQRFGDRIANTYVINKKYFDYIQSTDGQTIPQFQQPPFY